MSNRPEILAEGAKAFPPLAVTGASFMGMSLPDWAALVTVIYVVLQIWLLLPKIRARTREYWAKLKSKLKRNDS